ncbi:MAG: ABC transporter permease [Pirellulales bacterium]
MSSASPTSTTDVLDEPSRGFWSMVWKRFRQRRLAMIALAFIFLLAMTAIFAPAIAGTKPIVCRYKGQTYFPALGYFNRNWENPIFQKDGFRRIYPKNLAEKDPESWAIWPLVYQDPYRRVRADEWGDRPGNPTGVDGHPSRLNLFGTTQTGRRVRQHGPRFYDRVAGWLRFDGHCGGHRYRRRCVGGLPGGWFDMALSRLIEVVMCIPALVLILALMAIVERPTIWHMMAILGCTRWTSIARLCRAEFIKLRGSDYVIAAQAIGVGRARIMYRYILPNALAPVLVPITFGIAAAILIEASLSFLGFGAPPPNPSWGVLLNYGRSNYQLWWLIVFPGSAIFLVVLAYNLIGDALQEAIDPRLHDPGE